MIALQIFRPPAHAGPELLERLYALVELERTVG